MRPLTASRSSGLWRGAGTPSRGSGWATKMSQVALPCLSGSPRRPRREPCRASRARYALPLAEVRTDKRGEQHAGAAHGAESFRRWREATARRARPRRREAAIESRWRAAAWVMARPRAGCPKWHLRARDREKLRAGGGERRKKRIRLISFSRTQVTFGTPARKSSICAASRPPLAGTNVTTARVTFGTLRHRASSAMLTRTCSRTASRRAFSAAACAANT